MQYSSWMKYTLDSPTIEPSVHPSAIPTMDPTIDPTINPTIDPTPSPSNPSIVTCGQTVILEYIETESNGRLAVDVDTAGFIIFNVSQSDIQIKSVQVYDLQNIRIDEGQFDEQAQSIQVNINLNGRYQFVFAADSDGTVQIS